jgi:hypothetical protein
MKSPSRFNRARTWDICAGLVVLGFTLSTLGQDSLRRSFRDDIPPVVPPDFPHYYIAGRLAKLRPPENLLYYPPADHPARIVTELRIDATTPYGRPLSEGGLPDGSVSTPFIAPPLAAIMMEPLASLPWRMAYLVSQLSCGFMMMMAVYLAIKLSQNGSQTIIFMTIAFGVASLFYPFRQTLALGNIDVVLLLLWVLGAFLFQRGHIFSSAFCLALGTALKASPVFAVPIFVMRRQWRWLACYGVWSVLLLVFSVWGVGWQNHILWAGQVLPALSCGIKHYGNRSLAGFVLGLSNPHELQMFLPASKSLCVFNKALSGICYCSFLYWCWRKRKDSIGLTFEMILLPLVVLLVSPFSWPQHFVLSMMPLTYLWVHSRGKVAGASRLDLILLAGGTLTLGCVLPDYAGRALGSPGALLIMGAWVVATLAILWVGMRMYESCVADRQ